MNSHTKTPFGCVCYTCIPHTLSNCRSVGGGGGGGCSREKENDKSIVMDRILKIA
jgi:hypothetical protein